MTLRDKIKTRIYLKFCARRIYTAMIETDKAINKRIANIYLDDCTLTSRPKVFVYSNYVYLICGIQVQSALTNHIFVTNIGYYMPKDQVLNYRKYLAYVNLSGNAKLIRETPRNELLERSSL